METQEATRPSFARGRSLSIALHVVISAVAFLPLCVMLNYLAHRHNQRLYLSQVAAHKLTPLTLQALSNLTNSVKVICFFDRREPLFGAVASLLKEYQARSSKIELEFVDYGMPGRAQAIRAQYKLATEGETSRVIFDSGGQVRTVLATELSEYGMSADKGIRRTGFRGEQLFTSAILNVSQHKPVNAYITQGHGEHRLNDDTEGYGRFVKMLENNNINVRALPLLMSTNDIPAECGLLIVGGPTRRFDQDEITKIERYLARGGRMFALFSMHSRELPIGLEQLLLKWNIQVGMDWVRDPVHAQSGHEIVFLTDNFGAHPIVRPLLRSSVMLIAPRSVSQRPPPQGSADAPKLTEILFTPSTGQLLLPGDRPGTAVVADEGSIPLAVAAERGSIQGVSTEDRSTRIVVIGDSNFVSNQILGSAANSDFANQIVNWLVNRDALLDEIGPSPMSEYQILLSEDQMSQVRWLFLGAIPGVVVILGFFVWMRRRF